MKFAGIILGVLVILGLGFFVVSKPADDKSVASEVQNESESITVQKIKSDVAIGAAFIDVRTAEEFAEGHIEGAELLPLAEIQAGTYPDVAKDQKVYVYCRSGNRSAVAKVELEKAGYTQVVDLGAYSDVVALGGVMVN